MRPAGNGTGAWPAGRPRCRGGRSAGRGCATIVFFDVGDTLLERGDDPVESAAASLRALGIELPARHWPEALGAMQHTYLAGIYAAASLRGERALWRALAAGVLRRLPGAESPRRVAALSRDLGDYGRHYRPVAGMPELIADLRAAGRTVGIISNWPPSLPRLLAAQGYGSFSVLACSGRLRVTKPDPAIFRWALRRAGVPAEQAWHVGNDVEADYLPAAALGMRPVLWDPLGVAVGPGIRRAGGLQELRAMLLP